MNAMVPATPAMPLQDMQTLAVAIAKSGLFGIRTPEQALVLMAIAQAEGRHPVEAARDYDIISGKPAKRAEAMLRDFIQAGGKVQWHSLTDELADATFTHPQTGSVRIDWDMKRAQTAFGKKDMYAKFPRQMLRSRVVSEGVRTLWPLATSGMYEPGETADIVPEHNGPTLEHSNVREGDAQDVARMAPPSGREALNAEVPLRAAAADMPRAPRVTGGNTFSEGISSTDVPRKAKPIPRTGEQWNAWMDDFERDCASFNPAEHTRSDLELMTKTSDFKAAYAAAPPPVRRDIDRMLADTHGRLPEHEPPEDEVEIVGEEKLASGDD